MEFGGRKIRAVNVRKELTAKRVGSAKEKAEQNHGQDRECRCKHAPQEEKM